MDDNEVIDINHADEATLAALPGIGGALAARIVEYRQTVHPFEEVIELTAVPGISERMVRQFGDRLMVNPVEGVDDDMNDVQDDAETAVSPIPPIEPEPAVPAEPAIPPEPAVLPEPAAEDEAVEPEPEPEPIIIAAAEPAAPPELTPAAASTPPPSTPSGGMAPSQRRGCILVIIGSLVGALLGVALTLGALMAINGGTLRYAQENSRLRGELSVLQQRETDLAGQIVTIQAQAGGAERALATAVPMLQAMATEQSAAAQAMSTAQAELGVLGGDVTDLQDTTAVLGERINTVAVAAETFDTFLAGLRDLLVELEGTPPPMTTTLTITPTVTVTAVSPQSGSTPTPTPTPAPADTPAPTPQPTRTPRPTATPIGQTP